MNAPCAAFRDRPARARLWGRASGALLGLIVGLLAALAGSGMPKLVGKGFAPCSAQKMPKRQNASPGRNRILL
jgi:hypothetical protein